MRSALAALLLISLALPAAAGPAGLVEPSLHLPPSAGEGVVRVAVTLDACGGHADQRILAALIEEEIPATLFVTGLWLRRNPLAVALVKAHPDLFEIEDHGARHIPAIDRAVSVYGIASAGSPAAVRAEVEGGAAAMEKAGLPASRWFRGATAKYTPTSLAAIEALGYRIAGYSLNADGGSLLGAAETRRRVEKARDGDVLIAHVNQPTHVAGAGLVEGLKALKARGVRFVRLEDVQAGM